jgi:ATP-dependent RNA helicase DeaD
MNLQSITHLVLDEADEMLNMGFLEDVKSIMDQTATEKRTMLFSATMPSAIMQIAKKYMNAYTVLKVTQGELTSSRTEQIYFEVSTQNKFEALCRIIDVEEDFFGLVFCRTKVDVDRTAKHLLERGYLADALHGDIGQALREKILNQFKRRKINILIATDVAARGIDVQDISHVINYSLPQDPEAYVHRIGRTGRAGKTGNAITFVTPSEYRKLQVIKQRAKTDIRRENLPKVKDIINLKKKRIRIRLEDIIATGLKDEYLNLAHDLLDNNESENLLGALLQHSFQGELDETGYTKIADGATPDRNGKTRLFVAFGEKSGLTSKKITNILKEKCNVSVDKIHDIQVRDKFAFISLPFKDAEKVLEYFKRNKNRAGVYITKAKEDRSREPKKFSGKRRDKETDKGFYKKLNKGKGKGRRPKK